MKVNVTVIDLSTGEKQVLTFSNSMTVKDRVLRRAGAAYDKARNLGITKVDFAFCYMYAMKLETGCVAR